MLRADNHASSSSSPLRFNGGGQTNVAQQGIRLERVPNNRSNTRVEEASQSVSRDARLFNRIPSPPQAAEYQSEREAPVPARIVLPPELQGRARGTLQKILHPFTPPTRAQLAAEVERRDMRSLIQERNRRDIDHDVTAAYLRAAALCHEEGFGVLARQEFFDVWTALSIAHDEMVRTDKQLAGLGKVNKHPWVPVHLIFDTCARLGINAGKTCSVLTGLTEQKLVQPAMQADVFSTPPGLIPVVRLIAHPSLLEQNACTIL